MKLLSNNKALALLLATISPILALSQAPPPPPGVPLDFGLSAFIVGCVGYGVVKMKEKNKQNLD